MTPSSSPDSIESPSLTSAGSGGPAYELKFLLDEAVAARVETWARRALVLDPHGDPALGGAYHTTSLYFDTPQLDVYHRTPSYRRRKFRVRRYGLAPWAFLERKSKWGDRVQKRRTRLPEEELDLLAQAAAPENWSGEWFQRRLQLRRLRPACIIGYERTAFIGSSPEGALRLTLDRQVHGILSGRWAATPVAGGIRLLHGQVILEFKFRAALPALFKEVIAEYRLAPRAVSKYRLCREAHALQLPPEAVDA